MSSAPRLMTVPSSDRSPTTVIVFSSLENDASMMTLVEPMAAAGLPVLLAETGNGSRTAALKQVLPEVKTPFVILHDAGWPFDSALQDALLEPLRADTADAVFASRGKWLESRRNLPERALAFATRVVTEQKLSDPLSGLQAFRTEALRALSLNDASHDLEAELVVKLAAQLYRLAEVTIPPTVKPPEARPLRQQLQRARALLRYATVQNAGDNLHEGYNTLIRMEGAGRYNEWLASRFRPHLGQRVLEVGAGIGTITRQIEAGRELLIALEVDAWYVDRLKNAFRGKPHVRPYLSDVALADWEALKGERIDSILLSNVLEHIPDDAAAVQRFRDILAPGGALVVLVPAVPALFGSMDEAVGHHRRYTPESLRTVLEGSGFSVDTLEWMNLVGMPGWFVNGRLLKRRAIPPLQLRLYDAVAPLLARAESHLELPIGMSLFAVARLPGK